MAALEYIKIPFTLFPVWIVKDYNLTKHALNGYIHLEIKQAVWGLPQAGILANKCLRHKLALFGYFESRNTPGLWCHKMHPIKFTLEVGNFGIKYINKDDVNHLISCIKKYHSLTEDWIGSMYCGIQLNWDMTVKWWIYLCPVT
jgi:hypothetical protein